MINGGLIEEDGANHFLLSGYDNSKDGNEV